MVGDDGAAACLTNVFICDFNSVSYLLETPQLRNVVLLISEYRQSSARVGFPFNTHYRITLVSMLRKHTLKSVICRFLLQTGF